MKPAANPLPLGFLALAAGSLLTSSVQLGWVSADEADQGALILVAFVVPLQLLASIRGALNGLTGEVLDDHLHEHVLHAADEKARAEAVEEISEVLRTYIR